MAELTAISRTELYSDGTTKTSSHYYAGGKHVATKDHEGPSTEEAVAHFSEHAPEGHVLVIEQTPKGPVGEELSKFSGVGAATPIHPPVTNTEIEEPDGETPSGRVRITPDMPGGAALIAGGYTTVGRVRKASDDELSKVSGVGAATVAKIRAALGPNVP